MSNAHPRYTARFQLPELFERGRDELARCEVYRDDVLVAPSAGTLYVYDDSNTEVFSSVVAIVGGIAEATMPAAAANSKQFSADWHVEWLLTIAGVQHRFRNGAALIRSRLYPCITGTDVGRRLRALNLDLPATITTRTNFQADIDEADVEVQNLLLEDDKRPWLIVDPTRLRKTWLCATIAIVFEGLASQNQAEYGPVAADWRERFEKAYNAAKVQFDYDEDGAVDDTEKLEPVRNGVVWTC